MAQSSPWSTIHTEREALAANLANLEAAAWATPSLCEQWSVRDVLAHMTATAKMTPPAFFAKLAGSGFSFKTMTAKNIKEEEAGTPEQGLAEFRRVANLTSHPPGPVDSWLGETIIHAEDIRRPLGIKHDYPEGAVVRLGDFFKRSNMLIGAKRRIAGLTLTANDAKWTTGSGPEVSGPMLSLLLAMTGRRAALNDLSGEGLETLRARF